MPREYKTDPARVCQDCEQVKRVIGGKCVCGCDPYPGDPKNDAAITALAAEARRVSYGDQGASPIVPAYGTRCEEPKKKRRQPTVVELAIAEVDDAMRARLAAANGNGHDHARMTLEEWAAHYTPMKIPSIDEQVFMRHPNSHPGGGPKRPPSRRQQLERGAARHNGKSKLA